MESKQFAESLQIVGVQKIISHPPLNRKAFYTISHFTKLCKAYESAMVSLFSITKFIYSQFGIALDSQ